MPSKVVSTRHSNTITSRKASHLVGGLILEPQASIAQQGVNLIPRVAFLVDSCIGSHGPDNLMPRPDNIDSTIGGTIAKGRMPILSQTLATLGTL